MVFAFPRFIDILPTQLFPAYPYLINTISIHKSIFASHYSRIVKHIRVVGVPSDPYGYV